MAKLRDIITIGKKCRKRETIMDYIIKNSKANKFIKR